MTYSYRLRGFNQGNLADIELLNLMGFHPSIMKAKGYWERGFDFTTDVDLGMRDEEIFQAKPRLERDSRQVFFAVVDKLNLVVGWVWFYLDARNPLPAKIVNELKLTKRNSRIYQLSYEKLMSDGWPKELVAQAEHVTLKYLTKVRKGVIVEGLALAIARMKRRLRKLYVIPRKLVLYAFTHPQNVASQKVLLRNGFIRRKRKYSYRGSPHYLWVRVV